MRFTLLTILMTIAVQVSSCVTYSPVVNSANIENTDCRHRPKNSKILRIQTTNSPRDITVRSDFISTRC